MSLTLGIWDLGDSRSRLASARRVWARVCAVRITGPLALALALAGAAYTPAGLHWAGYTGLGSGVQYTRICLQHFIHTQAHAGASALMLIEQLPFGFSLCALRCVVERKASALNLKL